VVWCPEQQSAVRSADGRRTDSVANTNSEMLLHLLGLMHPRRAFLRGLKTHRIGKDFFAAVKQLAKKARFMRTTSLSG
jgi:hypothetical protein